MIRSSVLYILAAALAFAGPALANSKKMNDEATSSARASIPFADLHGQIRDWRADGRNAILIESNNGQWYRAEFMSPCHELPFSDTIGVVVDATRSVDKFGSIVVRSAGGLAEQCWFKSFQEIPDPGEKGSEKTK